MSYGLISGLCFVVWAVCASVYFYRIGYRKGFDAGAEAVLRSPANSTEEK
jgi:hypothetical protein